MQDGTTLPVDDFTASLSLHGSTTKSGCDMLESGTLSRVPASLHALPPLNDIIHACWQQRDLRRPAAVDVYKQLAALLQRAMAVDSGNATHA
jgi:hypothetical protein